MGMAQPSKLISVSLNAPLTTGKPSVIVTSAKMIEYVNQFWRYCENTKSWVVQCFLLLPIRLEFVIGLHIKTQLERLKIGRAVL
jgi:hypothetical protein